MVKVIKQKNKFSEEIFIENKDILLVYFGLNFRNKILNFTLEDIYYLNILSYVINKIESKKYSFKDLQEINLNLNDINIGFDFSINNFFVDGLKNYKAKNKLLNDISSIELNFFITTNFFKKDIISLTKYFYELLNNLKFDKKDIFIHIKTLYELEKSNLKEEPYIFQIKKIKSTSNLLNYFVEISNGITFIEWLKNKIDEINKNKNLLNEFIKNLKNLYQKVFNFENSKITLMYSYNEKINFENFYKKVFIKKDEILISKKFDFKKFFDDFKKEEEKTNFYKIDHSVYYTGIYKNIYQNNLDLDGNIYFISSFLKNSYLWDKIRLEIGVYSIISYLNYYGDFIFITYRDPDYKKSLNVLKNMCKIKLNNEEYFIKSTKISALSKFENVLNNEEKFELNFKNYIIGLNKKLLEGLKKDIINLKYNEINNYFKKLDLCKFNRILIFGNKKID